MKTKPLLEEIEDLEFEETLLHRRIRTQHHCMLFEVVEDDLKMDLRVT